MKAKQNTKNYTYEHNKKKCKEINMKTFAKSTVMRQDKAKLKKYQLGTFN